jgi:outer membrane lipoprotein-sorting protein
MNKILILLIGISIMFTSGVISSAQSLEEILARHYEAMGKTKLDQVKTIIIHGNNLRMGQEMPYQTWIEYPDKFRTESSMMDRKMIQVINGDKAWGTNPRLGEVEDITGPRLQQTQERMQFGSALLHYNKDTQKLEYLGKEDLEGTDVYVLKLTNTDGNTVTSYLDAESYVLLKSKATRSFQGNQGTISTEYSNYRMVDGIAVAFSIRTEREGMQGPGGRPGGMGGDQTIESIEFNKPIDPALFEKPVIK